MPTIKPSDHDGWMSRPPAPNGDPVWVQKTSLGYIKVVAAQERPHPDVPQVVSVSRQLKKRTVPPSRELLDAAKHAFGIDAWTEAGRSKQAVYLVAPGETMPDAFYEVLGILHRGRLMSIDKNADPKCDLPGCRGEAFARTTFRLEILGEADPPEWLPPAALQAVETFICMGCLKRSLAVGDQVGDAIIEVVGPLLPPPSVPVVRLVPESDERGD